MFRTAKHQIAALIVMAIRVQRQTNGSKQTTLLDVVDVGPPKWRVCRIDLKVLCTFKKTFFKLPLIEKPVKRETECRKPHPKIQNSYQVMKVSKSN